VKYTTRKYTYYILLYKKGLTCQYPHFFYKVYNSRLYKAIDPNFLTRQRAEEIAINCKINYMTLAEDSHFEEINSDQGYITYIADKSRYTLPPK
jgi:hypothetical protein